MTKREFSTAWKKSTQPRKQRKYRFNAPLHVKQKFMHVHLSKELRAKYPTRAVQLRKGDKVRILRGLHLGKEGKVDHLILKRERVYVNGIELIKKDGSKVQTPQHPSNLMIVDLDLSGDKYRKEKLESFGQKGSKGAKSSVPKNTEKKVEKTKKDESKVSAKKVAKTQ